MGFASAPRHPDRRPTAIGANSTGEETMAIKRVIRQPKINAEALGRSFTRRSVLKGSLAAGAGLTSGAL
jgi:hypothetical protein